MPKPRPRAPIPDNNAAEPLPSRAALERELAQLRAERDEALARETAIAEVLGVINSSPGDLAPVFAAMLKKATSLCEATFGILFTYYGDCFQAAALHNVPPGFAATLGEPFRPSPGAALDRLLGGQRFAHFSDVAMEDAYAIGRDARGQVELGGARSLLGVPLRREDAFLGEFLGAFIVYRQEVRPFTDKQIALLQNFAAQAVIAMENARLITETREALEQQTATAEVLGVINSSPGDLAPVFDAILEKAHSLCGADNGTLWTYDGKRFWPVAWQGVQLRSEGIDPDVAPSFGRIVRGEHLDHIHDMVGFAAQLSDDAARRRLMAIVETEGIRTQLIVALRKDDLLLGVISANRREVRPFSDKQIALLQNFAAQAVIAMENARLLTETREALEQQTATAEVLGVINSSPGDLAPVFDAMLDKALRLCDAEIGTLWVADGEQSRMVANKGAPPAYADFLKQGPHPWPGDAAGIVHIPDIRETELYRRGHPRVRAGADLGGVRTILGVPLLKDDVVLGRFSIYRTDIRPFTDKQIALLQNFAAQAVIAMENARLITETQEALDQQTANAEVLSVINSSPGDLAPVFDTILEKAHSLCGVAVGAMAIYDGEHFRGVAARGYPEQAEEIFRRPFRGNFTHQQLVRGERYVHIPDIQTVATELRGSVGQNALEAGVRTILMVPLRKDGVLLGHISASRLAVRPFTDKQIALLQNFAAQAVIAMENARLITETREALEQQTATAEVLSVINSAPGNLTPVFDAMLEKAMRLCEASFGLMVTVDGATVLTVAERDMPQAFSDFLAQHPPGVGADTFFGRAVLDRSIVHTTDMRTEAAYSNGQALAVAAVDTAGVRALLMAPLVKDDVAVGVFAIFRREARAFSDKQIALLENFAAQAVIAMENARLITETREALDQQTATAEVLGVINSSPGDLAPVFDAMLEKAHALCGATFGSLQTYDGEFFRTVAYTRGLPDTFLELLREPFRPGPNSFEERLVRGDDFVHIPDVAPLGTLPDDPLTRSAVEIAGLRTLLLLPLRKEAALVGYVASARSEVRPFSEKEIALLQNFAAQAVIAMENARLLGELRERNDEIAGWNQELEARVAAQLAEIERAGKLRRFLAPQLAELIVAQGDDKILESHRREIVVVFCDLRGFTGFAERAEPEEVMALLRDYHAAMGPIVARFEGTIDHYSGDGIMVFFNDPVPTPDPARRAIDMAVAMREAAQGLLRNWRRRGHDIGFGVGIAQGYATLGQIGFAERMDYTAIGTVTNLAARLCAEAKNGQILLSARVAMAVEDNAQLEEIGDLALKGLSQAVAVYNVPL